MEHHPFGPSRLFRRAGCPGSFRMERDLPDETSPDAEMGIRAHAAVWDTSLRASLPDLAVPFERIAKFLEGHGPWEAERTLRWQRPFSAADMILFGTADAYCLEGSTAILADWKFGATVPEPAAENLQLACLALLVHLTHPEVTTVQAWLVPARFGRDRWTMWEFTAWPEIAANIREIIARCQQPALILKDGPHCRYCLARHTCPAVEEKTDAVMRAHANLPAVTPANAADLYDAVKLAEKKLKALLEQIQQCAADNPGAVPGLELRSAGGRRGIENIPAAFQALHSYITQDQFLACCTVKVDEAVTLAARGAMDLHLANTLAEGKAFIETKLGELIVRGQPTQRLERVTANDKDQRP